MNKKTLISFELVALISLVSYGFMVTPPSVSSNCVRIQVQHEDGSKNTNAKVSGDVCGGGVTDKVITNNYGYADICYDNSSSLCCVFIEGKKYENGGERMKKGKEYTIKMR